MGMITDELYFKPKLRIISDEQIRRIHEASLDVLERTGVELDHPQGLEILDGAGAKVDGQRVRFPSWMVEAAIQKAPPRIVLGRRTGERTVFLEGDKSFFGPSLDCIDYLDPESHERVRFVSEHVKVTAALCDSLGSFEWCMTIGMSDDVAPDVADRIVARNTMQYCRKPLVFCCKDTNSAKDIYEMALLLCGGKDNFERAPCLVHYSEPISPLAYYPLAVDKIIFCAQNGIPLINFPAPQVCGSAPGTFAGTLVQGSAESLSGLVLTQATNPGAPFIYGAFTTIMDMKTSVFSYGAMEIGLMTGAMAQMAQYYRLPFFGTAGATDAKFCDAQAGAEATLQCLTAATVGSGLVHDCGAWLDHGSLVSPEYMVMVDDIVDRVMHFMQGIPVNDETLAVDLIDQVGPNGHYLQEEHTMKHFRKVKYSDLFDRSIYESWQTAGGKKFDQRLQELTLAKMQYRPEPLADEVVKELDRMQASWK
jgi:trimethylamine--corrinoid protein Co-methyltransferase